MTPQCSCSFLIRATYCINFFLPSEWFLGHSEQMTKIHLRLKLLLRGFFFANFDPNLSLVELLLLRIWNKLWTPSCIAKLHKSVLVDHYCSTPCITTWHDAKHCHLMQNTLLLTPIFLSHTKWHSKQVSFMNSITQFDFLMQW